MDGSDNQMDHDEAFLPESYGYAVVRIENKSADGTWYCGYLWITNLSVGIII